MRWKTHTGAIALLILFSLKTPVLGAVLPVHDPLRILVVSD